MQVSYSIPKAGIDRNDYLWQHFVPTIYGPNGVYDGGMGSLDEDLCLFIWRRSGFDSIEMRWCFQNFNAGSSGTGDYSFALPAGFNITRRVSTFAEPAVATRAPMIFGSCRVEKTGTSQIGVVIPSDQDNKGVRLYLSNGTIVGAGNFSFDQFPVGHSFHAIIPVEEFDNI